LKLELTLLGEAPALRIELVLSFRRRRDALPETFLQHSLPLFELLIFESLLKLKRFQTLRIGGREILRAAPDALLQVQVECVLLLLKLETTLLEIGIRGVHERQAQ